MAQGILPFQHEVEGRDGGLIALRGQLSFPVLEDELGTVKIQGTGIVTSVPVRPMSLSGGI